MQIMLRHAKDDFTALSVANGMEQAGAEVISITDAGGPPFSKNCGRFILWARVQDEANISEVDKCIDSIIEQTVGNSNGGA